MPLRITWRCRNLSFDFFAVSPIQFDTGTSVRFFIFDMSSIFSEWFFAERSKIHDAGYSLFWGHSAQADFHFSHPQKSK